MGAAPVRNPEHQIMVPPAEEEIVLPRYAGVDWYNPIETISYIRDVYGKFSDLLIWVVRKESSFDPEAKNPYPPLQYGFGQLTEACVIDLNMNYDSVLVHPWYNLEATQRFWKLCLKKADWDRTQAYEYYRKGLWYNDPRYLAKKAARN